VGPFLALSSIGHRREILGNDILGEDAVRQCVGMSICWREQVFRLVSRGDFDFVARKDVLDAVNRYV
jgi:hypothetical protein